MSDNNDDDARQRSQVAITNSDIEIEDDADCISTLDDLGGSINVATDDIDAKDYNGALGEVEAMLADLVKIRSYLEDKAS